MNYTTYVPTPEELVEIEAKHRQAEIDLHEQVLHDLMVLGREIITVQRQKVSVQSVNLARDAREVELRHHPDLTIPFDRLARAIRMVIQLHLKILDLCRPPEPQPGQPLPPETA